MKKRIDISRAAQATQCLESLQQLRPAALDAGLAVEHLDQAIAALNRVDMRCSSATARQHFHEAQQHVLYALRLKTPR